MMNRLRARIVALALLALACDSVLAASDRHVVLISDLHVGAGKDADGRWRRIEDFRWHDDFEAFLDRIAAQGQGRTDLVLAGDVFELWQSPAMVCSNDLAKPGCEIPDCHEDDTNLGCTEPEAQARLQHILRQHPGFVEAIRRFAARDDNRVHFIPGNHDAALLFAGVRAHLLDQFRGTKVAVHEQGYWLSADGQIYADHGHQFDEVNAFGGWPSPFVERDGTTYLRKPWGENMVQQFYNRYEHLLPIVDNLSDEQAGVHFAVKHVSVLRSAAAVGRFLRFFVFQQSLRQAWMALGDGSKVEWDLDEVRKKPVGFFLDVLAGDPDLSAAATQAQREGGIVFDRTQLTREELTALCAAKDNLATADKCPRRDKNLSALVKGTVLTDDQRKAAYLREALKAAAGQDGAIAAVYVHGHTHRAEGPAKLKLGDMRFGPAEVVVVNTGAFQRVASSAQLEALLEPTDKAKAKPALDLVPEDLPACYTYASIEPYKSKPQPQLRRWLRQSDGRYVTAPGRCLDPAP
jgi:UDP-2,3-diacylglucosamine pyrophosphatase LpxH